MKKPFILIIITVAALALIGVGLALVLKAPTPTEEKITPREFTPFPRLEEVTKEKLPEEIEVGRLPQVVTPTAPVLPKIVNLEKITDQPVAGAAILEKERLVTNKVQLATFDFTTYPNLKTGASGEAVKNLQVVLNRFAEKKELTSVEEAGSFDTATKNLVIIFQKEYKLTTDGAVGKKTKVALNNFQKPEVERVPLLRYALKESGHVYETYLDKIETKKITNVTIPRLAQAFFTEDDKIILRYAKNNSIETFLGIMEEGEGVRDLESSFLPSNIFDLAVSPDKKSYFYLAETSLKNTNGVVGTINGNKIFESPFTEWLTEWADKIYLQTKASTSFGGFLYGLDPKTRSFTKILGNIPGLTTLVSPNGKSILLGSSETNSLRTQIYDISQKSASGLGIKTLPEKCVFTKNSAGVYCAVPKNLPSGNYPDDWYQGLVSFNDDIWQINLETLSGNVATEPAKETGENVDAINLILDSAEKNLVFINKKDGSLWRLRI